jgi:hypothetical protein
MQSAAGRCSVCRPRQIGAAPGELACLLSSETDDSTTSLCRDVVCPANRAHTRRRTATWLQQSPPFRRVLPGRSALCAGNRLHFATPTVSMWPSAQRAKTSRQPSGRGPARRVAGAQCQPVESNLLGAGPSFPMFVPQLRVFGANLRAVVPCRRTVEASFPMFVANRRTDLARRRTVGPQFPAVVLHRCTVLPHLPTVEAQLRADLAPLTAGCPPRCRDAAAFPHPAR